MTDSASHPRNALVVGATSGIGRALVRHLAEGAYYSGAITGFVLAGRDPAELQRLAADLATRSGVSVAVRLFDADDLSSIPSFFAGAVDALPGGLHELLLCHGWLPDADASKHDPRVMRRLVDVNYTSAVIVLELAAALFERQASGAITAISSVAGDRGRQSNYPYGASKAALTAYLQGLRNRLHPAGIPVLTVKPGFTDTAMTWGRVASDSPLNASPERVAADIGRAMRRRRDSIYTPWFWQLIMGIFKWIPERLFKRLKT